MSAPLITIGLVVYNGERHLAAAIESIRSQTFRDFILVIYDNASTDHTSQIARQFAALDHRIEVVRHRDNVGALNNFIIAAERARTPYFCWAAHDDLHEPDFLRNLIEKLEKDPRIGLASCNVIELDPDGARRNICAATAGFRPTASMSAVERVVEYMRDSPCSPIYGIFRTTCLQTSLDILRANRRTNHVGLFGGDLVFLAGFIARFPVVMIHEPLLALRAGGESHRADAFRSIFHLGLEMSSFFRSLDRVTRCASHWKDRLRLAQARWSLYWRYATWPPTLRIVHHHVSRILPGFRQLSTHVMLRRQPFADLRQRASLLPPRTRCVLFGGGKHTRRHLRLIQMALGSRVQLIGIADDYPSQVMGCEGLPVFDADSLKSRAFDLILISSDTYEETLYRRAAAIAADRCPIWCIYDRTLERLPASARSNVAVKNESINSIESVAA